MLIKLVRIIYVRYVRSIMRTKNEDASVPTDKTTQHSAMSKLNFCDNAEKRKRWQNEETLSPAATSAHVCTFVCTITHFSNLILLHNIYDRRHSFHFNGTRNTTHVENILQNSLHKNMNEDRRKE